MRSFRSTRAAALAFIFSSLLPFSARAEGPPQLPLRAVRFYEVGVGYFERKGQLDGASKLTLPLPTAHLDDALKSLVVMSSDGKAQVAGVEFESTVGAELGRALAGVEGESEAPLDWTRVLRSMKGADVGVRTRGEAVRGRLVDILDASTDESAECIEQTGMVPVSTAPGTAPDAKVACRPLKSASLVLLTEGGAVRRFRATQVVSVQPTDAGLARRLRTALAAIAPRSDQLPRGVRILGTPGSEVTLGYVSETPVWRSTYRVVFAGKRANLQGWALIHNDTDEDWRSVKVELVNGRPDAFMYPLAAPRYARRDLVTPENEMSTVPQLLAEGSPDRQWSGHGQGGLGLSGVGQGGGGRGEGIGLGNVGTLGHGSGTGSATTDGDASSTELSIGSLAGVTGASGVESEALFRYSLPATIDLRAHGSALVPFVSKPLGASRITWFPTAGNTGRSAARLKNETGQTLPGGTIAFFADGGFAGESLLDRMKPSDVRVLGFGVDLDVSLDTNDRIVGEETRTLTFDRGLREHFVRHREIRCAIENRSGTPRDVFFTLPVIDNARVEGADSLDFDTHDQKPLAQFAVGKKTSLERTLAVEEAMSRNHALGSITVELVTRLARSEKLPPSQREILNAALAHLRLAEQYREEAIRLTTENRVLEVDIQRLRDNLTAAGTGKESKAFRERLLAAEDRLRTARERITSSRRGEVTAFASVEAQLARLPRSKS
jgi:hypothetical protein